MKEKGEQEVKEEEREEEGERRECRSERTKMQPAAGLVRRVKMLAVPLNRNDPFAIVTVDFPIFWYRAGRRWQARRLRQSAGSRGRIT
jgi:hypothetical protein